MRSMQTKLREVTTTLVGANPLKSRMKEAGKWRDGSRADTRRWRERALSSASQPVDDVMALVSGWLDLLHQLLLFAH